MVSNNEVTVTIESLEILKINVELTFLTKPALVEGRQRTKGHVSHDNIITNLGITVP